MRGEERTDLMASLDEFWDDMAASFSAAAGEDDALSS